MWKFKVSGIVRKTLKLWNCKNGLLFPHTEAHQVCFFSLLFLFFLLFFSHIAHDKLFLRGHVIVRANSSHAALHCFLYCSTCPVGKFHQMSTKTCLWTFSAIQVRLCRGMLWQQDFHSCKVDILLLFHSILHNCHFQTFGHDLSFRVRQFIVCQVLHPLVLNFTKSMMASKKQRGG